MAKWTAFPHAGEYAFDAASVRKNWSRLHLGDAEPLPADPAVLQAWALFHSGEFQKAQDAGLKAGGGGVTVANKAACVYATYLEKKEKTRLDLFMEAAQRAQAQAAEDPKNANAWYLQGYALGRYSQGISVARALAQGLGSKLKHALERVIELEPAHADAHVALAAFHAEVIDKVGALVGRMTYGVRAETAVELFERGLELHPQAPGALMEYGRALLMLHGDGRMGEATRLYEKAAAMTPADAKERLDVELARAGLSE